MPNQPLHAPTTLCTPKQILLHLRGGLLPLERQSRLTSLRLRQLFDPNIRSDGDVGFRARGDQNELASNRTSSSDHLEETINDLKPECSTPKRTYKHVDGHFSVDMIHVHIAGDWVSNEEAWVLWERDIQLIKATNRRSHGFPEGEQQTDLRE